MGAIAGTTAAFGKVPKWAWRAVHAASFGAYVLALTHGLTAGTDVGHPIVTGVYVATTTVMLAAVVQRLLLAWEPGREGSRS
jgi:hypothetical protein